MGYWLYFQTFVSHFENYVMPLKTVLLFLLGELGHGRRIATFGYEEVQSWEKSVLPILLGEKLLVESAELAKRTTTCHECEQICDVSIHHNHSRGQDVIFCTELEVTH
jgi:hypothetical protein